MSDSTGFRLMLVQPENVDKYIEFEDENNPSSDSLAEKSIFGTTRNGWFVEANRELIADAGLKDSIKFLSNERHTINRVTGGEDVNYTVTGEHQVVPPEEWKLKSEQHFGGYLRQYTIIPPKEIADIASQLNELSDFCAINIDKHHMLSDYVCYSKAQELLDGIAHYNFKNIKNIDDCPGGDEGNTGDYYFFALHTIKNMINESVGKGLVAIYVNEYWVSVKKSV